MMKYPVGGPREPVYQLMRSLGFVMSKKSDKEWTRGDITVHIFAAGSTASVIHKTTKAQIICPLDKLSQELTTL
jgi:hypothetical protein